MPDELSRQELAANYGFALAFMESDPDLKKLFRQATRHTWTSAMFVAKLRDTKWFKKHSASVRNAIMQETADPATYKANIAQMTSTVKDAWGRMFGGANFNAKQMRAWAETAHRMGWSEAQLVDQLTKGVDFQKLLTNKRLGGTAAETKGQIDQLVSAYGLTFGDRWKGTQLEKIMQGDDTVAGVKDRLRALAMQEYGAFADRIQGGESVQEIADPYVQQMADLLEINPYDLTLKDKTIQNALKQRTPDGKAAAMDLHTFADVVRKDNRWQYTDNAKKQVSTVASSLFKSFGLQA